MPQNVINLLDGLLENGSDKDIKVLGEGIKATLEIVADMSAEMTGICSVMNEHIKDKDQHTPKGILVRGNVIGWFITSASVLFTILYIVANILGIEELIKMVTP